MPTGPIGRRFVNGALRSLAPFVERFRTSNLNADLVMLAGARARVVFDVGANRGQTSASLAALFPDATVFAFEPLPQLCEAIKALRIPRVLVVEAAVGETSGSAVLHVNADSQTNSLLRPNSTGRQLFSESLLGGSSWK